MCPEAVVFRDATPPDVDHLGTIFPGTHAVFPMIRVGEATTGPPQVGDLEFPQRLHHILSHAMDVRNLIIALADVESSVDTPAQVLGEMPVDIAVDGDGWIGGLHCDPRRRLRQPCNRRHHKTKKEKSVLHVAVKFKSSALHTTPNIV